MKTFLRWTVIGLAGLGILVALFYAEEDVRGWHAWNKFKHEWEARGEKFDFASIVPPTVPDDRNFAMSPVWIAEIKYNFQNTPERAKAWYGDRIDDEDVSKIVPQLPVGVSGLVGNNWGSHQPPATPEMSSHWTTARATDLKPWQSYYRDLETTTPAAGIPISPQPQSPAADVLLALSKFDPVIEKLRQDSALPGSRFPVIYTTEDPAEILLPHLAVVKRYAQILQLRASAELQNGQGGKALADVKLMLRLNDSVRNETFLITHLVRIAIVNIALQPVWEGMAAHQWSDAQLTELNAELAKLDFLADYKFTMRGEMVFQGGIFAYLKRHPDQFPDLAGDGSHVKKTLTTRVLWHLIPSGWFYQNQLSCASPMVELFIPLADTNHGIISPKATRQADAAVQAGLKHHNLYNIAQRLFLPSLGGAAKRFAYGQESADLARVAIALERFRLAQGEYPGSLDALEPRFIEKLPQDIINGEPLHYRRSFDGKFLLYSVGWNETDDDGQVGLQKNGVFDNSKGDWVWKY
jgi:hypothetical protein